MFNFVLKYTGAYGLLAIVALTIATPSYFFFRDLPSKLKNQPEKEVVVPQKEVVVTEKKEVAPVAEKSEETPKPVLSLRKSEKKQSVEEKLSLRDDDGLRTKSIDKNLNDNAKKASQNETTKKGISASEAIDKLSIDIFRVDEFGNIISAGQVTSKARVDIISDNLKVIGSDKTEDDGSFVVFGKIQGTGLVQTVKIRGVIEAEEKQNVVESADIFFVVPKIERNNEKEKNSIKKQPLVIKDDGESLKVMKPLQVSPVNSITLDTISYTDKSKTELAGRARLKHLVRLYLNNNFYRETLVNSAGAWVISLSNIESGLYNLRLDEIDRQGTVRGRLELPFKKENEAMIQTIGEGSITVQPGNSLWRIARRYYGKGIQYVDIFERNSHLIKDPDLIYPGQIFSLPN
ncbi:LysM peptidoglycan-binding domain-containing protein [Paracoccaceae bacterium]|nr:LysM peptidoglycan-binding domain-containing protein [Paracoccaceae bacterium]